jgi:hypothetical protein
MCARRFLFVLLLLMLSRDGGAGADSISVCEDRAHCEWAADLSQYLCGYGGHHQFSLCCLCAWGVLLTGVRGGGTCSNGRTDGGPALGQCPGGTTLRARSKPRTLHSAVHAPERKLRRAKRYAAQR